MIKKIHKIIKSEKLHKKEHKSQNWEYAFNFAKLRKQLAKME